MRIQRKCKICKGEGELGHTADDWNPCGACFGRGYKTIAFINFLPVCRNCFGTGTIHMREYDLYTQDAVEVPYPCECCRGIGYTGVLARVIYQIYWAIRSRIEAAWRNYKNAQLGNKFEDGTADPFCDEFDQ